MDIMRIETHQSNGIKVTVHIPDDGEIPEYIKREKINQLYDILAPKTNENISRQDKAN